MGYDVGSGSFVDENGWVMLDAWTGQALRQLPRAVRDPDEALTHCDSIVAAVGDLACDPRSGGVAGTAHLAQRLGVSAQQFRRHLLPHMPFVRDLHGIPVSNVGSVDAWAENYRAEVQRRWQRNLEGDGE